MFKKFLPSLVAVGTLGLMSVGFTSCIKDYTCECEISYTGKPGLPASTKKQYTIKDKEDEAKSICENSSSTIVRDGITTTENCKLY